MAARIDDYGLIGDMKGSALVSKSGDIDWMCVPRFDSEACIAALLGRDEHGRWGIRPTTRIRRSEQCYRGDTLILETEVDCDGGRARIVDFMPIGAERSDIVRIVEGVAGEVLLEMILDALRLWGLSAMGGPPGQRSHHGGRARCVASPFLR